MADEMKLQFLINAKDDTKAAIKSAKRGLTGLQDKMKSVQETAKKMRGVGIGATAIGGGIAVGVGKTVKAYQEQEVAEKRLEAIATKVTGATKEEIEGFKEQARELQKVGVVGDEVVISGQSQLASFTKSAEVVTELTDDLADLAVGTYGVNVSQEQSIQTANLMGKALSGQLGALTRTGVLVSEELKVAFHECNTEEERAVVLSKIIQDNYGGLNEQMRQTSAGGMQDVINSVGDMQEDIGGILIPIIMELVDKIKPIIEQTIAWMEENKELTEQIIIGVAAFGALMLVLGPLLIILPGIISAVSLLIGVFGLILSPIGLVLIAVGLLIAIGYLLIKHWDEVKATLIYTWEEIKKGVTKEVEKLQESILIIWEAIKEGVFTKLTDLKDSFIIVWDSISEYLDNIWKGMENIVTGAWENIKATILSGINWAIDKINYFIRQANKVAGMVPGMTMISEIAHLAKGGIVTKPTVALIGEAGPEAVIPLNNAFVGAGVGGGTYITNVYVQGGNYLSEDAAEMFGEEIANELKRNKKL